MTQGTNIECNKHNNKESGKDSALMKTFRVTINFVTNILIVVTVFACLLYSCTSKKLNIYQLHIVLCVIGYQIFMTQGTLALSRYNSWSMFLSRRYKIHLHCFLQFVGIILVIVGSSVMIYEKHVNFDTAHGILGLLALITSVLSFFNGLLAGYAGKLSSYVNVYWMKFIHYLTGVGTLIFSAICLCLGFDKVSFKSWAGEEDAIALMIFTCFFTMFVAFEFWINFGRRLRNLT